MAGETKNLVFDVIAKDHASQVFNKVGHETSTASTGMSKFKKVAAAGLLAVGAAAVEFGKKSVEAYQDVAKESSQLARVTGMTIQQSSRLRFAAEESGVEFGSLQKSMQKFSKAQATGSDQFEAYELKVKEASAAHKVFKGSLGAVATTYADLGISLKDAHGHAVPMQKVLMETAEEFKKMPDGPQKTAYAMQLFGKSGTDMIKILNKGKEGIKELGLESDKTGNTIKNTDSYKANIKAQREMSAAVHGLMIQVGQALMPVITALSEYLAKHVAPTFTSITKFVQQHKDMAASLVPVVVALVAAFTGFKILTSITEGWAALDAAMEANPIGVTVVALAALTAGLIYAYKHSATFRSIVQGAFQGISAAATFMWTKVLQPTFKFIVTAFLAVAGAIVNGAAKAFGWIPGLGGKLKAAATNFNAFKQQVNDQLNGIHKNVAISADTSKARKDINSFVKFTKQQLNSLPKNVHAGVAPGTPGFARGTNSAPRGMALVGEDGPELVGLRGGEQIIPAARTSRMLAGGGDTAYATVNLNLDGRTVQSVLLKLKRTNGGLELGLA